MTDMYGQRNQAISRNTSLNSSFVFISASCLLISLASIIFLSNVLAKWRCETRTVNAGGGSVVCFRIRCLKKLSLG
ncbi:hypothetical protein Y032_0040g226 [Ancylostoma ceylanicum]|uniref:Uncharacterized protein n=1 Tax=Ancylostoma ceylanicum TaxID=53326 RepID=A0A016UH35_9BILA|nr:hypothetical protein Y032_0040g226 [Ancylostoma ceylanicum]